MQDDKTKLVAAQLPKKYPYESKARWIYKKLIKEEKAIIEIAFETPPEKWPITKNKKYKLLAESCGLSFHDDNGNHLHLEESRFNDVIKEIDPYISCSETIYEKINECLISGEVTFDSTYMTDVFNLFIDKKTFGAGQKVKILPIGKFDDRHKEETSIGMLFSGSLISSDDEGDDDFEPWYQREDFFAIFIKEVKDIKGEKRSDLEYCEIFLMTNEGSLEVMRIDKRFLIPFVEK